MMQHDPTDLEFSKETQNPISDFPKETHVLDSFEITYAKSRANFGSLSEDS